MQRRRAIIEAAIRNCDGPAGAARLARALGFPAASALDLPLPDDAPVDSAALLAGRGSLSLFHLGIGPIRYTHADPSAAKRSAVSHAARWLRAADPARLLLLLLTDAGARRVVVATFDLAGELRRLDVERDAPKAADLDVLEEMVAEPGEGGVALALRIARALDRGRLADRFFREFRAHRDAVATAWRGIAPGRAAERRRLALLLLCRLMFLCFLQDRGRLGDDRRFLIELARAWTTRGAAAGGRPPPHDGRPTPRGERPSFYRAVLRPLFFGALNEKPERRSAAARALGDVPYLNGGLFDRTPLERRHPRLDLPDDVALRVFDGLLDRYRFHAREAAESLRDGSADVGIDPEMLGQVFEGLMDPADRGSTGSFYTPATAVASLAREAVATYLAPAAESPTAMLDRLCADAEATARARLARRLAAARVLDPACGSGAFLLGALLELSRIDAALRGGGLAESRRRIVSRGLYGVDVQADAALLCSLRLWLALAFAGADPPPLPNLDRRIRQGDALLAPLDLATGVASDVRRAIARLAPLSDAYAAAGPRDRPALARRLARAESRLARAWIDAARTHAARTKRELSARAADRDLFGEPLPEARRAARQLAALADERATLDAFAAALEDTGAVPFFSFDIHFAEAASDGFDLVLSNPPWVRAHAWPKPLARRLRRRYAASAGGWIAGARLGGAGPGAAAQSDIAVLFLHRALRLLAPGGVLGMLLPAKILRSLYGAAARRALASATDVVSIVDHSLDQRAIFRADAFTTAVVARRPSPEDDALRDGVRRGVVRVTLLRPGSPRLRFDVPHRELPLIPGDPDSPWLLVPPAVRAALRRMQAAGPPLGESRRVRRGVVTGANDVLLFDRVEPKLGDLVLARPSGASKRGDASGTTPDADARAGVPIEASDLAPVLRGSGIRPWSWEAPDHVIWLRDDRLRHRDAGRRTTAYLARHAGRLRARSGSAAAPLGAVARVSAGLIGPKVAWHDLAANLHAVALPATIRTAWGAARPLVPLNTAYFIAADDDDEALLLAALLNALPLRTFARAVAERAKDARFRFFGWVVGVLPLAASLFTPPAAPRLVTLSRTAHRDGALRPSAAAELDRLVADAYGLGSADVKALLDFDAWLRGGSDR